MRAPVVSVDDARSRLARGMTDLPDDVVRVAGTLTPAAREALRRALRHALGRPGTTDEPIAAELVNTEAESATLPMAPDALDRLVARAAREGGRAPMVRLGDSHDFALLVSPEHVWTLAERLDELTVALEVLASAVAGGMGSAPRLEALLALLDQRG